MAKKITQAEFADLLEVSRPLIIKAVKTGRLSKSITRDGTKVWIDVVAGVLEFYHNADLTKDRGDFVAPSIPLKETAAAGTMSIQESNAMDRHYTALMKQLEYSEKAATLMPADKFKIETFQAFRAVRDGLLYIPQTISEEVKVKILAMIQSRLGDEQRSSMQSEVDGLSLYFRTHIKSEIKKAILQIAGLLADMNDRQSLKAEAEG